MPIQLNPSSGMPLYLQLIEQIKHAIETGAMRAGDQLPSVRQMAEELMINPNTVVRAYRELEHEGIVELRHGLGAFISSSVSARGKVMRQAQNIVESAIERLRSLGVTEQEMRRLFESELSSTRVANLGGRKQ